jgi:2-polyprenyl-6-hydroxyphenyl methylase/3-demethylubiquinone-9 3-methyltransferase
MVPIMDTASPLCKICGSATVYAGAVDFHQNCAGASAGLTATGIAIDYHRCRVCGFLFTCAFDAWGIAEFQRAIYNQDYGRVDPDYETIRPTNNASAIEQLFGAHRTGLRVLDYGGGNGALAAGLRQRGFDSAGTYDPFDARHAQPPQGPFDLITCFETLEHLPDPLSVIGHMMALLADSGIVLFSTSVQPMDVGLDHPYVAPRNGHVSIFSHAALARAWASQGCHLASYTTFYHIAFREIPAFAAHLLRSPA